MQNVRPQRKNPSFVLLRLGFRINTSTEEMCIRFVEFSRQFGWSRQAAINKVLKCFIQLKEARHAASPNSNP